MRLPILLTTSIIISGCSSNIKDIHEHQSIDTLLESHLSESVGIMLSKGGDIHPLYRDDAETPTKTLRIFCQSNGGNFSQETKQARIPRLDLVPLSPNAFDDLAGQFNCRNTNNNNDWKARIEVSINPAKWTFEYYLLSTYRVTEQEIETAKKLQIEKSKREKEGLQKKQLEMNEARERARKLIPKSSNIGREICKSGDLSYIGEVYIGGATYQQNIKQQGGLVAVLEGFSSDGYRIKFRVQGYSTASGRLNAPTSDHPKVGKFSSKPGVIYWDDVDEWSLCSFR